MDPLDVTSPANASPPDFDFNLPCRYFKSSFARSLSLTNASNNNNNNQCKSLDYDLVRSKHHKNNNNNNNNNNHMINNNNAAMAAGFKRDPVPPIPQKRYMQDGCQNEAATKPVTMDTLEPSEANVSTVATHGCEKPPALPARRPISGQGNNSQSALTQLRQQAFSQALSHSNAAVIPVNIGAVNKTQQQHQQQLQQNLYNRHPASNGHINNNSNNTTINNNTAINGQFRRNIIVWPNKQNVEQECNFYDADNDDDINSEYHETTKLSANNNGVDFNATNSNHHQQQQQQQHLMIPTITTTNVTNNQHHHQQHHLLQQHHSQHHLQQQQQQQQQLYDIQHDNTTNVEAVILQNQVDTLQWQLKQVETSCDMYRAVMEEVARFLERYQKQRQQQQQLQQQQQQQQHQMAAQKHSNCNGPLEQISRSKSLYQVYGGTAGDHDKSLLGNNLIDETSASYLRARSSTNLIDLKQAANNNNHNMTTAKGLSKDDHNFETGLTPGQSYSAFKDYTWRRSPKKANEARTNNSRDDVEEKLNQEAFRLLRTIHNLLNTSQHQPDLAHPNHQQPQPYHHLYHRHSLAASTALNMGRISKAMSTSSVATLPGAPMHNSTSLTLGSNCASSTTSESSEASATITTAANAASATNTPNTLAPEMLFLRSANMRDSRLSLRSSTDSSVHSSSSAASSASSKVETDEEPITPFHSPPNNIILAHKQHHHLTGSSTEDESGFSSISSFPELGVPLSSTMMSSTPSSKSRAMAKELKSPKVVGKDPQQQEQLLSTADSRNSTLKANVVGLPLNSSQDMSHRWDSPSKTYHNASTKFQRFSALSNEDSSTVLWV